MSLVKEAVVSILGQGGVDGSLLVADNSGLATGTVCLLVAAGKPTKVARIIAKTGTGRVVVGDKVTGSPTDVSAFGVGDILQMYGQSAVGAPDLGLATCTTKDLDLYVDPVKGSNTNDGSLARPFKHPAAAIASLPKIIRHTVNIWLAAGDYYLSSGTYGQSAMTISGFVFDDILGPVNASGSLPALNIIGPVVVALDNLTVGAFDDTHFPINNVQVAGAAWAVNQWKGYYVRKTPADPEDPLTEDIQEVLIVSNTADTLVLLDENEIITNGTFQIVSHPAKIYARSSDFIAKTDRVVSVAGNKHTGSDFKLGTTDNFAGPIAISKVQLINGYAGTQVSLVVRDSTLRLTNVNVPAVALLNNSHVTLDYSYLSGANAVTVKSGGAMQMYGVFIDNTGATCSIEPGGFLTATGIYHKAPTAYTGFVAGGGTPSGHPCFLELQDVVINCSGPAVVANTDSIVSLRGGFCGAGAVAHSLFAATFLVSTEGNTGARVTISDAQFSGSSGYVTFDGATNTTYATIAAATNKAVFKSEYNAYVRHV
jgi:hypothetical protein